MIWACWISTANPSYSSDRQSASLLQGLCYRIQKAGGDAQCVELVKELLGSENPQNAYIHRIHHISQATRRHAPREQPGLPCVSESPQGTACHLSK